MAIKGFNNTSGMTDGNTPNIADYVPEQLRRLYIYEQTSVKPGAVFSAPNAVSVVGIQPLPVTLIADSNNENTEADKTKLVAREGLIHYDEVGNAYIDVYAEINVSGLLQQNSRESISETKYNNAIDVNVLISNYFPTIHDKPRFYTLDEPYDYEAYINGLQEVYTASWDNSVDYSFDEISNISNITDVMEIENQVELQLSAVNEWDEAQEMSRIIFIVTNTDPGAQRTYIESHKYFPYISDGLDIPHVNNTTREGQLIIDDNFGADDFNTFRVFYTRSPLDANSPTFGNFYFADVTNKYADLINVCKELTEPDYVQDYDTKIKTFYRLWQQIIDNELFKVEDDSTLEPQLISKFLYERMNYKTSNVIGNKRMSKTINKSITRIFEFNEAPYSTHGVTHKSMSAYYFGTGINATGYNLLSERVALNVHAYLIVESDDDGYDTLENKNAKPYFHIGDIDRIDESSKYYDAIYQMEVEKPEEITATDAVSIGIKTNPQALISNFSGVGYEKITTTIEGVETVKPGFKTQLNFTTNDLMVPLMIKVVDVEDKVTVDIPWFNKERAVPYFEIAEMLELDVSTEEGSGFNLTTIIPEREDRALIYNMMLITKLYNDKFKWLPVSVSDGNAGQIEPNTKIGADSISLSATLLQGQTAHEVNDGLIREWEERYVILSTDERMLKMRRMIMLLSKYISCSDSLSGGNNPFNAKYLNWYLTINSPLIIKPTSPGGNFVLMGDGNDSDEDSADKITFRVKSKHFVINEVSGVKSITAQTSLDISNIRMIRDDGDHILHKFTKTLTAQTIPITPSVLDPTADDSLGYVVFVPIKSLDALKRLYLDKSVVEVVPEGEVIKTFNLPNVYNKTLLSDSDTTLTEDIIAYVSNKYGVIITEEDIEYTGTEQVIENQYRVNEVVTKARRTWPAFITNGMYSQWRPANQQIEGKTYDNVSMLGHTERGVTLRSGAEKTMLYIRKRDRASWWGDQNGRMTPYELQQLASNLNPVFQPWQINITNINAHTLRSNRQNAGTDYRWWEIIFQYTVKQYRYNDIRVKLRGQFTDVVAEDRPKLWDKQRWYQYVNNLNLTDIEISSGDLVEYQLYAPRNIDYITELDVRILWGNTLIIILNGVEYVVPLYNKDNESITYQKILIN